MMQAARTEPVSSQGLGAFPVTFDVAVLPERRSRAALRFYARWSAVAVMTCGALGGVAMAVAPLKGVEPVIAVDGGDGVYGAAHAPARISGDAAYAQSLAEDYIETRFTIVADRARMNEIWGDQGRMAAIDPGFSALVNAVGPDLIKDMGAGILQRAENIRSETIVAGRSYVVDFDIVRRNAAGGVIGHAPWRAHIETAFDPAKAGTMANPLGFQIMTYNQEPRR